MKYFFKQKNKGFTIIEIIVATTIFAIVASSLLAILNYTYKINRKSEALRQASQGMRSFVEYLVKEIRNGEIYYGVETGGTQTGEKIGPCPWPHLATAAGQDLSTGTFSSSTGNSYNAVDNRLALTDSEGNRLCVYLAGNDTTYVGESVYYGTATSTPAVKNLVVEKSGGVKYTINPPNFVVEGLRFYIRPRKDPFITLGGGLAKQQPSVTMLMKFKIILPTGEVVPINYETTVSSDKYNIPSN